MSFPQAEAKRNLFTKDFMKLGPSNSPNWGSRTGENGFLSFHFQHYEGSREASAIWHPDGFIGLSGPRIWHAGRKTVFHGVVDTFEMATQVSLRQQASTVCGFVPVTLWEITWGQSMRRLGGGGL